jgi:putative ABC transport system ATP-binding protein
MTAPILEARSLVKTYAVGESTVRALDGVSLSINRGEMVAIVGESGSGKSTLMNILGCLDRPDSGEVLVGGEEVSKISPDRQAEIRNQRIGFVFQSFNLLPRLSALDNVELPLLYAGRRQAKERALRALEKTGMSQRKGHRPSQLSGGQRQRVAISRALVTDPDILLADEPTGNLDSRSGSEILLLFEALHREGRTLLIVSHNPEVFRRCPREIEMLDGRIVADRRRGEEGACSS